MTPFALPPYPYDRLNELRAAATERFGAAVDMSIGAPADPPPDVALEAMVGTDTERGYPPSIGSPRLRNAASAWLARRVGVEVDPMHIGATIGLKEFVVGAPHWLRHRDPVRDTVLYPAVSYPSYAMGAELAHCRAVPVPLDDQWRIRVDAIDPADADRAVCLWVNSPGNPAGGVDDLAAVADWGRARGVPVLSDECYVEFRWNGPPVSILHHGSEGVLAIHSLSKRSNFAGARAGFYAGDPDLVHWMQELRKHLGFMVPGPIQAAAAAALADDAHVDVQRAAYQRRLAAMIEILGAIDVRTPMPEGGFYLWAPAPGGDSWGFAERLAHELGVIVSPGEFYGPAGDGYVRLALVVTDDQIGAVRSRLTA